MMDIQRECRIVSKRLITILISSGKTKNNQSIFKVHVFLRKYMHCMYEENAPKSVRSRIQFEVKNDEIFLGFPTFTIR